jgi:hypothetical protein
MRLFATVAVVLLSAGSVLALQPIEISEDGCLAAVPEQTPGPGIVTVRGIGVPYGPAPDWQNSLRVQVGGLAVADLNGDGWVDLVVGCYHSQSYPPYPDWENLIYYNIGGQLEAQPSWISLDEVSTTDVAIADINGDGYLDIFAANGDYDMAPCVIYWGSPSGPSNAPGWYSQIPNRAWTLAAVPFDWDHDGDIDVITANQGNSPQDPFRPIYGFINNNGVLAPVPGWQTPEISIQNGLAFADYDGDGWEDLAVSKWDNGFASCIYRNVNGTLQTAPAWTTGVSALDKCVAWADVDRNGWPDLALGHSPTWLFANYGGVLTRVWQSAASYFGHQDLKFCDVNRDGWPDLAEIHFSDGKTHIYLNRNGTLDSVPTWTYDSPGAGTAIAFADINGDRWPDLICGYSGQPSVVVFYARPPQYSLGDLNCDGQVNAFDIDPFVLALTSTPPEYPEYYAQYPSCNHQLADVNGDGLLNAFDIDPFVDLLTGS